MSQISLPEAADVLNKLLAERIPVTAFFISSSLVQVKLDGFVDSITRDDGLHISESGPPIDTNRGWMRILLNEPTEFWYGKNRELPYEIKHLVSSKPGESALVIRHLGSGERLALFFTI